MTKRKKAFKDWQDWAKTDWREFTLFFIRRYGVENFGKVEKEFASQMKISTHVFSQLTNIAIGKAIEYGVSSTISGVISIGDILSQIAGYGFVASQNEIQGHSRYNPITLWKQEVFSDNWYLEENRLGDYVRFILYWYPKDIDAGHYGFRYGAENDNGACSMLRTTKKMTK